MHILIQCYQNTSPDFAVSVLKERGDVIDLGEKAFLFIPSKDTYNYETIFKGTNEAVALEFLEGTLKAAYHLDAVKTAIGIQDPEHMSSAIAFDLGIRDDFHRCVHELYKLYYAYLKYHWPVAADRTKMSITASARKIRVITEITLNP